MPVTSIAKMKTTIQMVAIGAMILGPMADNFVPGALAFAYVALWVAAGLTVYTGYVYFRRRARPSAPGPSREGPESRAGAGEAA